MTGAAGAEKRSAGSERDTRVAVVMITMDRPERAAATLARLRALPEQPPIVVVNNGAPAPILAGARTTVIDAGTNLGAAGRNVGVAHAGRRYVAFADDDSWWAPGSLTQAADLLDRHPDVALLAGEVTVHPAATVDPFSEALAASPLPGNRAAGVPILGFMACAAVVRTEAFMAAGGFGPEFGIGGEEDRLAWDLATAGWQLRYNPALRVHHRPAPRRDHVRRRHQVRNAMWTIWQRLPAPLALRASVWELRRAGLRRCTWLGLADALRGAGPVLRQRSTVAPHVAAAKRVLLTSG